MTNSLIQRIRKARELAVEVEGFRFTVRRPTDYEAGIIVNENLTFYEVAQRFVVDWSGVKESDLLPGGGSDVAPFSMELWGEWMQDRPAFWEPISNAALKAYSDHQTKRGKASKN